MSTDPLTGLEWLSERPERKLSKNQCQAVVQPGEFLISIWDDLQCSERNPRLLARCEGCRQLFCTMKHLRMHYDSVPADHFESA